MKAGGVEPGDAKNSAPRSGVNTGISILDVILRLLAFIGTPGSAIAMGTTNETLPFFTQFSRFRAEFFVIENAVVSGYLILSLPLSIFNIVRSKAQKSRIILFFFKTAMLALLTAGAATSAAIVYLAHKRNARVNWFAICQQYNSFCGRISGSLIGFFAVFAVYLLIISLSGVARSQR